MFVEIILEKVTIDDFKVCDIPPLQQGALVHAASGDPGCFTEEQEEVLNKDPRSDRQNNLPLVPSFRVLLPD